MKLDKDQIIGFLQDKGEDQKAKDADEELPQKVDTDKQEDQNLLEKLGIDPMSWRRSSWPTRASPASEAPRGGAAPDLTSKSGERTR